jgi:PAS domain S-box-containing protein/excisionase family DNA binding protein
MARSGSSPSFAEYHTVGEAAAYLGVSRATVRNWDRAGKLKSRRHPQNGYRIYLHEELEAVLRSADLSSLSDDAFAPEIDWSKMSDSEHFVQFYESDEFLVESASGFIGAALTAADCGVVIATPEHRASIDRKLAASGIDLTQAIAAGRYVSLDAGEVLARFMIEEGPDPQLFTDVVGRVIAKLARNGRRIHAFGEMVALLWADGNRAAAIRLEELWNELAKNHRFALFCGYPIAGFADESHTIPFDGVCACHTRVIPAESYAAIDSADKRLRAIGLLQQKAQSLNAEIAHRHEVEKVLSNRERELSDFFENATEGLHKVGPDGTILWANKAEYGLLGYSADEYIGRSITDFHADSEVIAEMLQMLREGQTLENFPARLRCKDGEIKHVLINSNAYFENGEFIYTRCFTRDVTRQWHAEKALHEADHRKDEFLATLAHELRNPLAPVRNALELLKIDRGNEETIETVRGIMERQVNQMTRLVDDLLDLGRIARDKIELRKQRVDLASVVQSAVETSRPWIDSANHQLTITTSANPILVEVDPTRMAQVFSNLLNNSAKYTEPGGSILLQVERRGREAIVRVRDNGIGIPCDALAHVFEMFRQVDGSRERAQGGLGIGLTLVRRLVELHGGTVNAQSEGAGKGSEFVVRLPIARATSRAAESPHGANAANGSKQRILVVDDNKDSGDTLSLLLQSKGHAVRTARDGLEAVGLAAEFLPDVILMDVGMPRLNGYAATQHIRQTAAGKDVFIVALTGWGQADDLRRSQEAGCSAHLVKPVDFAALENLLASREALSR